MPIHKVEKNKWKYGSTGKVFKSKKKAIKQGQAIAISKKKRGK